MNHRERVRIIHRDLIDNNVGSFNQWKNEGHSLSFFHENIIDYQYLIRNYIFNTTTRTSDIFPLKIKHKGWPHRSPMTPQAWTVMELITGLKLFHYDHVTLPQDLADSLAFVSTCILSSEIEILWNELLESVYICNTKKAEIWVGICMAMIIGYNNQGSELKPFISDISFHIDVVKSFFTQYRKIQLIKELYYSSKLPFDEFIKWTYDCGRTPRIIRSLISSYQRTEARKRSLSSVLPSSSPQNESSSCHLESPSEQTETLGSSFSPSSPPQE